MKKKAISLLLALVLTAGLCAGCGSKNEPAKAETEASTETKQEAEVKEEEKEETKQEETTVEETAERLPLVKDGEEATLTIGLRQNTSVSDYETNAFTLWVEEQTGINLEFSYFNSEIADAATQLSLMISSGEELPDILWGFRGLDAEAINEYGRDEYFLDLTDYYANHAYYINEALAQLPESEQARYFETKRDSVSGGYYGVPLYLAPASDDYQSLQSINKEWLDAVGMKAPTTVDELYDVLVAFRDKDPNGNGKADEIPIIGHRTNWRANISDWIVNAFVFCDRGYLFNAEDGKLWFPFTTDEYREAMIYLNKLCSENLLSTLSFTAEDFGEIKALVTPADGTALTGIWGGHPLLMCESGSEIVYEYVGLAPLKDATGSGRGGYINAKAPYLELDSFITSSCENPELAFKLLDFFHSKEAVQFMRFGVPGEDWEVGEGTSLLGAPADVKVINTDYNDNNSNWGLNGSFIGLAEWYGSILEMDDTTYEGKEKQLELSLTQACQDGPVPEEVVYSLIYLAEEQEVVAEVKQPLVDYLNEARAQFATGVLDPNDDAVWQNYLDTLENIGLPEFMEVAQTAYSRMNGK